MADITYEERKTLRRAAEDARDACNRHYGPFVDLVAHPLNILALLDMADRAALAQQPSGQAAIPNGFDTETRWTKEHARNYPEAAAERLNRLLGHEPPQFTASHKTPYFLPGHIMDDIRRYGNECVAFGKKQPSVQDREDAERYRWLKENIEPGYELPGGYYIPDEDTDTWDKTIDSARAAKGEA